MKSLGSIRREKGMTQTVLAKRVGVTQRAIASYESGTRRPSPAVAERIARALGMDVETMWRVLYQEKKEETA
ncbi:MAG: helix-turn-helix transcriptional regulator [Clostridiales bacterium]|nr:helix-turn-helix transcriptional regulator [Clostridiales bacterium]